MTSLNRFSSQKKASSVLPFSAPKRLVPLLKGREGPAIVYVTLQKHADEVVNRLRPRGIEAAIYHAGLPNEERARVQKDFMASADGIVVCTIAFGMGIDKDIPILEGFCRGDTCSLRGIELWLQEISLKEPSKDGTLDFILSKQAKDYDIRQNVLGLNYAQLELEYGHIRATTPFFSVYELTPVGNGWISIKSNQSKVAAAMRPYYREKNNGKYEINVTDAAAASGLDKVELTKQITSWELDVLKPLPKQTEEIKKMAEKFHAGMVQREEEGIEKIRQVIEFAVDDDCLAHNLAKYFGDDKAVPDGMCGRCTFCTAGQSVDFPGRTVAPVDQSLLQAILHACPERDDPRLLARMAFGITSPRLTSTKCSTSHDLFGSMVNMDFNDLVAAFDVECRKAGYQKLDSATPKKRSHSSYAQSHISGSRGDRR
ncbi:hypothetical protein C0991_000245, partial [Blastosporella zonata]